MGAGSEERRQVPVRDRPAVVAPREGATFGATGDLAGRFLLPALAALHAAGHLPDPFQVTGAAREGHDDESFRRHASARLEQHASDVPPASRQAVVDSLHYRTVDLTDEGSVAGLARDVAEQRRCRSPPTLHFLPTIRLNAERWGRVVRVTG